MIMENEIVNQVLEPLSGIVFLVFLLIFIVVSVVLNYHWTHYGISADKIKKIRLWYFTVSAVLLLIITISIIYIIL